MLAPGDVLNNRYRLDDRLATGGMGAVWRATDQSLGRTVAVKTLLPALVGDPGFTARFQAEARMLAALRHPGVVQVYDYGESGDPEHTVLYLVMAFVDGEPLSDRIAVAGRLPADETMSIVAQVAGALEAVHAVGIVHRDLKPANLLVQPDGTVTLVDFGVAHDTAATRLTGTNMVLGTALYMAPEQVSGGTLSAATDVYALGAVAYHCLAGQPPFSGGTALAIAVNHLHDEPPPLPEDVPEPARAVVGRALRKDPAARYPSATAFATAARAAAAGRNPEDEPEPTAAFPVSAQATTPLAAVRAAVAAPGTPAEPGATLSDMDAVPPTQPSMRPASAPPPATPDRPAAGDQARRRWLMFAAAAAVLIVAVGATVALMLLGDNGKPTPPTRVTVSVPPATSTAPARPTGTHSNPVEQTSGPAEQRPPSAPPTTHGDETSAPAQPSAGATGNGDGGTGNGGNGGADPTGHATPTG